MSVSGKFFVLKIVTALSILCYSTAAAENYYVIADFLNGRAAPSKNSSVEARFECGDIVTPIQLNENGWVEVYGGETGTVWCKAEYVSACSSPIYYEAEKTVNLRKNPSYESKIVSKIKKGRTMKISAEVFGWGYIRKQGWVDLSYFREIDN